MFRRILVLCVFTAFFVVEAKLKSGPAYPATKGEVWPKPQHQIKNNTVFIFEPGHFKIKVVGTNCSLLRSVISRYRHYFVRLSRETRRNSRQDWPSHHHHRHRLSELRIDLTVPCEEYPYLGMDESYSLTIAAVSTLKSTSIWGIMRGFQTLTHMLYLSSDYNEIRIAGTEIVDYPRYSHRGLMLDTSRHFISMKNIFLTLDAMEMNKMNVFHWHIVDDQSFPYQSERFPELSEHGAYHISMVYSKADIDIVVKYARERGIRVVPEFDIPGHTQAWGLSHPEILTKCHDKDESLGPMNPIVNATYELLAELIQEVNAWFPDKYLHVGGDEVDFQCWESNSELAAYMRGHNITTKGLLALFENRLFSLLKDKKLKPIVWQEIFDNNVTLSSDTPVQIWYDYTANRTINEVLNAGKKVIFSSLWYLDHLANGGDWEKYYLDPRSLVANPELAQNVIGGEACMWTEAVDDRNVISRVWPRASAVAEVLWSSSLEINAAKNRLEEHTCRMIRREIGAQPPNGPGFCI